RRHTRCYRDWSSDVCSSDLSFPVGRGAEQEKSTVSNRKSIDLMREIDNAEVGGDAVHYALAESHRIVKDAEIGHEDDGWRRLREIGRASCREGEEVWVGAVI